jgi:hypothetical protein
MRVFVDKCPPKRSMRQDIQEVKRQFPGSKTKIARVVLYHLLSKAFSLLCFVVFLGLVGECVQARNKMVALKRAKTSVISTKTVAKPAPMIIKRVPSRKAYKTTNRPTVREEHKVNIRQDGDTMFVTGEKRQP